MTNSRRIQNYYEQNGHRGLTFKQRRRVNKAQKKLLASK